MKAKIMRNLLFGCLGVLIVFGAESLKANAEEVSTGVQAVGVESSNNYGGVDVSYDASALGADATAGYILGWDSEEGAGPGIGAYAEANAVAAQVNQSSSVGSENNNLGYDMGAAVGKAAAKASAAAVYDDGGVSVNGELKAEAIAAEASAGVSTTVGGVEAGAKVTGQVGVGVSAGASYSDGKLEIEIGAALGVGGKISATVDASKAVHEVDKVTKLPWWQIIKKTI